MRLLHFPPHSVTNCPGAWTISWHYYLIVAVMSLNTIVRDASVVAFAAVDDDDSVVLKHWSMSVMDMGHTMYLDAVIGGHASVVMSEMKRESNFSFS